VNRTLPAAVVQALRWWPGIVRRTEVADLSVLPPFFTELLFDLPWWDRAWRVTRVEPAYPVESPWPDDPGTLTEVSVPGTLGDSVPFSARVRFEDDRLLRFQAKIADTVLGPAATAAGRREPHPFGAVFSRLMDHRGYTDMEMARECGLSLATIRGLRGGGINPHRRLITRIAGALALSEEDLAAIAGLPLQ
jgi:hypothetical protein